MKVANGAQASFGEDGEKPHVCDPHLAAPLFSGTPSARDLHALLMANGVAPMAANGALPIERRHRRRPWGVAGIEPLALPEDVLAEDLSALVPEDHPSRKSHVVVYNA